MGVGSMTPIEQTLQEMRARCERAHESLCGVCKDPASFRMSIPAQQDDTDIIIQNSFDDLPKLIRAVEVLYRGVHWSRSHCSPHSDQGSYMEKIMKDAEAILRGDA